MHSAGGELRLLSTHFNADRYPVADGKKRSLQQPGVAPRSIIFRSDRENLLMQRRQLLQPPSPHPRARSNSVAQPLVTLWHEAQRRFSGDPFDAHLHMPDAPAPNTVTDKHVMDGVLWLPCAMSPPTIFASAASAQPYATNYYQPLSLPGLTGRRQAGQPGAMTMRRPVRSSMLDRERQIITANGPRRFQRTNARGTALNSTSGDNTPTPSGSRPTLADVALHMQTQPARGRHGNSNHTESTLTGDYNKSQLAYFEEEQSVNNSAASTPSPTNNDHAAEEEGSCYGSQHPQPAIERVAVDDDTPFAPTRPVPDTDFRPYDSQSQYSYYQHFYRPNQRNKNLIEMLSSLKLRSNGREKQRKTEDNEITSSPIFYSFVRPCAAEFLGTIIYVYFTSFGRPLSPRPSEIVCIGLMRAVCTLVSMLVFGHISGGQFNPVLTVASWLSGGTRTVLGIFYVIVQFFGAFMGALLFRLTVTYQEYDDLMGGMTYVPVRPPNSRLLENDISQPTRLQALMLELVITYVLCLAYVLTMVDTDGRCAADGPIATAGATLLGTMAAYSTTRASMNPAKSFASSCVFAIFRPDLISWDFHYVYWIGPLSGALLAAVSYRCLFASDDFRILFTRDVIKSEDDDNQSQHKIDANEAG